MFSNAPTLKEFLNAPHCSNGFEASKLNQFLPKQGRLKLNGASLLNFSFTSNLPHDSIKSVTVHTYKLIKNKFEFFDKKIHFTSRNKEGYHQFSVKLKDKGEFFLRIYLRQKLTFTYEVNAK